MAGSPRSASPGFIYGTLVVPRFVLDELQHIADSSDTLRRNRGRRGLEILAAHAEGAGDAGRDRRGRRPSEPEVDAKLVALARTRSRVILTNDFNLNRVAELQGVRVMNINSLANAVKPAVLPGEELRVRVIQEGKEAGPGRRLPRRRDDDRRRRRRPPHRQGPRRVGHPRAPDRGRTHDLRPAAARLSGSPARADAIVVAAGSSQRMGGIDKLAWPVAGRPVLAHTLAALAAADDVDAIVVVTAADRETTVAAADWLPAKVRAVVAGRGAPPGFGGGRVRRPRAPGPGSGRDARPPGPRRGAAARRPGLVAAVTAAADRHGAAIPVAAGRRDHQAARWRRVVGTSTVDPRGGADAAGRPAGLWRRALADPVAATGDVDR